jgi:alpha-beta hydrolase superfamily lysophospholipase
MKNIQGNFRGVEGMELYFQAWLPEGNPRAVLTIVHGAGDHISRYERVVAPLVASGFACYGFDMRGYGRSGGRRGHIKAWSEYREDLRIFLNLVHSHLPGKPVFLFGFSLGALVALEFVLRDPHGLQGVILSGTPIEPAGVAGPLKIALARALSRFVPTFSIELVAAYDSVTRDPAVIEALHADALHHNRVTARWGTETMAIADWVRSRAAQLALPVLFIHGGSDPLNLPDGVQHYYEQVTFGDKEIRIYPESRHETHGDLDYARVVADLRAWMTAHVPESEIEIIV